jgi:hypothetical protein
VQWDRWLVWILLVRSFRYKSGIYEDNVRYAFDLIIQHLGLLTDSLIFSNEVSKFEIGDIKKKKSLSHSVKESIINKFTHSSFIWYSYSYKRDELILCPFGVCENIFTQW